MEEPSPSVALLLACTAALPLACTVALPLAGIAYDHFGRRLFITGKKWPSIFEVGCTGEKTGPIRQFKERLKTV